MSRIGKTAIQIPADVTVALNGSAINVKGPKGELSYGIRPEIEVSVEEGKVTSKIKMDTKKSNALWGTTNALIKSMVVGVTNGYEKKLELVGVGYRVNSVNPSKISLAVGYSHPVEFSAPEGVTMEVIENREIVIKGIDKQLVGLAASQIRKVRKPEPYKGKGIKYSDEIVRRKAGKSGKV